VTPCTGGRGAGEEEGVALALELHPQGQRRGWCKAMGGESVGERNGGGVAQNTRRTAMRAGGGR